MKGARTGSLALVLTGTALVLCSCAVPEKGGFDDVQRVVSERSGPSIHWYQGTPEDAAVAERVRALLERELSIADAVQIALLNNRGLQATYEELGVAQAEVVQAGLLDNPTLFGQVRFPDSPPAGTGSEFEIAFDLLELLLLPARKRLAELEFEAARLHVAHEVLDLVARVKSACFRLQGSLQIAEMLGVIVETEATAFEFARRQHAAGNINELDLSQQQATYERARLQLATKEADILEAREHLTELMGLWGVDTGWRIASRLPEIPSDPPPLEHVESRAIADRLDLAARKRRSEALGRALATEADWRWIGAAEVGANTERESDRTNLTGPHLRVEPPIFDQGQARIARLEAMLRRSQQETAALAIEIRSEVRAIRDRLLILRDRAAHYRLVVIPLHESIVSLAMRHYNFMLVGVYRLLEAKQDQIEAYREYLETVRDYWLAWTDLERAVGGRLSAGQPVPAAFPPAVEPEPHEQHRHGTNP